MHRFFFFFLKVTGLNSFVAHKVISLESIHKMPYMDVFFISFRQDISKVKLIFPETCRARLNLNKKLFSMHYGVSQHRTGLADACVHWMI